MSDAESFTPENDIKSILENSKLFTNRVLKLEVVQTQLVQCAFTARIRSNLATKDDVKNWVADFASNTCTGWIVHKTYPSLSRKLYREDWLCQESAINKTKQGCANCPAFINIEIKKLTKDTVKKDPYLRGSNPLTARINIHAVHNHSTQTTTWLTRLHPSEATKRKFLEYFMQGHGPAAARQLHIESIKLSSGNPTVDLVRGDQVPSEHSIAHLYAKFRRSKSKSTNTTEDYLFQLQQNIGTFLEKGTKIVMSMDRPFSVVIATPVMQRLHTVSSTAEIIYIHSPPGCFPIQLVVTLVLAASKAGAIPIAVLLHENQSQQSYHAVFSLLQNTFPVAFCGRPQPRVFLTDNLATQRAALRELWPDTRQLLCLFQVQQAVWQWLWSSQEIPPGEPHRLMNLFTEVMRSRSVEDATKHMTKLQLTANNNAFVHYVSSLFESLKEEWVIAYRSNVITRGFDTNNYAEDTVRLLKELVTDHQKPSTTVTFMTVVEHIVTVLERHYQNRLYELTSGRLDASFTKLKASAEKLLVQGAVELDTGIYQVSSASGQQPYIVNLNIGLCSCLKGERGALCKHQLAIALDKNLHIPNFPPMTAAERHDLAWLAYGDDAPSSSFFMNDTELLGSVAVEAERRTCTAMCPKGKAVLRPARSESTASNSPATDADNDALPTSDVLDAATVQRNFISELTRLSAFVSSPSSSHTVLAAVQKLTDKLQEIETEDQLVAFLAAKTTGNNHRFRRKQSLASSSSLKLNLQKNS